MNADFDAAAYAHAYLAEGFLVLPLYWYDERLRQCACGRRDCPSPGKHPIGQLTPRGLTDATADDGEVARWLKMYPQANLAIRTGRESGVVVVDIDPRHGGEASWEALTARHGVAETYEVETGSGGRHLYFRHPGPTVRNSAGLLAEGIDVRGEGGYVVAPPSNHATGGTYRIAERRPMAPMPAWLLTLCQQGAQPSRTATGEDRAAPEDASGRIPHGRQHYTLVSLAGTMRRRGMTAEEINAALQVVNRRCERPGSPDAIRRIAESVAAYDPAEVLSVSDVEIGGASSLVSLGEAARASVALLRAEVSGTRRPLSYGVERLDRLTGGQHRGELSVVAARPSHGKTTWAVWQTLTVQGASAVFSVEMARHPLMERYLAHTSGVAGLQIRARSLSDYDFSRLDKAAEALDQYPVFVTDRARTVSAMLRDIEALEQEQGARLDSVYVDYLQLVETDLRTRSATREQAVADISRSLKRLAIERDVAVVALCQLSRGLEHRADRHPCLADLRESGQIEQDSDVVLFLHRAELYGEDTIEAGGRRFSSEGLVEVMLAKQRNGPTGKVVMQFDGSGYGFREHAWEYA